MFNLKYKVTFDSTNQNSNRAETVKKATVFLFQVPPLHFQFHSQGFFLTLTIKKPPYFVNFATISILRGSVSSIQVFGEFIIFSQRALSSEVESIQSTVVP